MRERSSRKATMVFQTYIPHKPLSTFIDYFWFYSDYNPPGAKELNLPEAAVDLIIDLCEDKFRIHNRHQHDMRFHPIIVCGPQSDYFVTENSNKRLMMGAHFRCGGAGAFLGAPSHEVYNLHMSLHDLWGAVASDLRDELLYASSISQRFRILEKYLLARSDCSRKLSPAVTFALKEYRSAPHSQSIRDTTEHVNLSPKRFIQVFREEVGMAPKRFCRVMRFQKALLLVRQRKHIDWADVAFLCGYYDQPHFIKDFRAFSGLTPTEYRLKTSMHPCHVPIL